jgi:hypothetical protein
MKRIEAGMLGSLAAAVILGISASASAQTTSFDWKIEQGAVGTSFATLTVTGDANSTQFSLATLLSGGGGDPGIVELLFGCNGCSATAGDITSTDLDTTVTASTNVARAGYTFDYGVSFSPEVTSMNPVVWDVAAPVSTFLEHTPGSGIHPDAFALIQLTGGMQTINGINIESGHYVATGFGGVPPVPEPSTYALMLAGLGIVGLAFRRRQKTLNI